MVAQRGLGAYSEPYSKLVSEPRQELRTVDSEFTARISRARKVNSLSQCQATVIQPSQCSGGMQFSIFKMLAFYYIVSNNISSSKMFFSKTVMR